MTCVISDNGVISPPTWFRQYDLRPAGHIGPRPIVIRPAKLFVNLLLVTTSSFILFYSKDCKNIVTLVSSAALHTSATLATDFKPYRRLKVSCPSKKFVRYKVLQERIKTVSNSIVDTRCCRRELKQFKTL
jgi:hypothetical protein